MVPTEEEITEKIDVRDEVADFYPLLAVPASNRAANVKTCFGPGRKGREVSRVQSDFCEAEVLFGTLAVIAGQRDEAGVGRHEFVLFRDNEDEGIFRVI